MKSQKTKYDPVKLRELGRLGAGVFAGKKDALERFNEKAGELGLEPRIDTGKESDDLRTYQEVYNFLRTFINALPPKEIPNVTTENTYQLQLLKQKFDSDGENDAASVALYNIAISGGGELGTYAFDVLLAVCRTIGPEFNFHEMDFVNIVNAVARDGLNAEVISRINTLYGNYVFYAQPESAIILNSFVEAMLCGIDKETFEGDIVLPFTFLDLATNADLVETSQRKPLLEHAAGVLGRVAADHSCNYMVADIYPSFFYSLTVDYDLNNEIIVDAIKLLPSLSMTEPQKKMIREGLDSIFLWGPQAHEMARWYAMNKDRFGNAGHQSLGQEGIIETVASLQKQLSENSERLNEALRLIRDIAPTTKAVLESVHKGHVRKYSEAVSSGSFGVLDYSGTKIVYALVKYEDIDNMGVNADGLILVARDRTRNGKGKEDKDLQKIVAVHEFVESMAKKEGRPSGEAHDLAIKAQEEYVRERGLAKKYADFLANSGQVHSNGKDNFGF